MAECPSITLNFADLDANRPSLGQDIFDFTSDQSTRLNLRSDEGTLTERTSLTINPTSSRESDNWVPLSFGDEFFAADGKDNDFRPGGDNTVKAEKRIASDNTADDGHDFGYQLYRNCRIPELISFEPYARRVSPRIERDSSVSTDESASSHHSLSRSSDS